MTRKKYTFIKALIPFSYAKLKDPISSYSKSERRNSFLNGAYSSLLFCAAATYLIFSLSNGSADYRKWPEIARQEHTNRRIEVKNRFREEFNKADLDGNGSLNFFEYFKNNCSKQYREWECE